MNKINKFGIECSDRGYPIWTRELVRFAYPLPHSEHHRLEIIAVLSGIFPGFPHVNDYVLIDAFGQDAFQKFGQLAFMPDRAFRNFGYEGVQLLVSRAVEKARRQGWRDAHPIPIAICDPGPGKSYDEFVEERAHWDDEKEWEELKERRAEQERAEKLAEEHWATDKPPVLPPFSRPEWSDFVVDVLRENFPDATPLSEDNIMWAALFAALMLGDDLDPRDNAIYRALGDIPPDLYECMRKWNEQAPLQLRGIYSGRLRATDLCASFIHLALRNGWLPPSGFQLPSFIPFADCEARSVYDEIDEARNKAATQAAALQ